MMGLKTILALAIVGVTTVSGGFFLSREGAGLQALSHLTDYPLAVLLFLASVVAITLLLTSQDWGRLDEAQREARKWASLWGGGVGMCLVMPLAVMALFARSGGMFGPLSGELGFFAGIATTLVCVGVCSMAAERWWWRK